MLKVRDLARKVADSDATVLLSGESGTGKEVVANLIHQAGNRSKEHFVALNCAAIAPTLIEIK
jgi:DNA-binding NtrC family response regulator